MDLKPEQSAQLLRDVRIPKAAGASKLSRLGLGKLKRS
jgi:hypothetical protein